MTTEKSVQFCVMRTVGILSVLLALTGCDSSVEGTRNVEGLGGEGSSETGGNDSRGNTGGDEASSGGSSDNTGGDESTGGNEPQGSGGRENNIGGTESTGGSDNTGGVVETGGTGGIVTTGGTGGSDNTGGTGGTSMECEPGDQKCTDLDIEICSEEGQWEVSQTCPFVCNLDQMFGAQCIGTCEPDTKQCSVEGYTEVCNEYGQWMVTEVCPNACVDGECVGSCEPSEIQCAGDNVQFCNSNGAWDVVDTCEFVCSGGDCIGVCEPGSVDCLGDTPRTCNAQGQWVSGNECPFMCSAGSCTGSCEPGAKKCSGNGTQTCTAQGTWSTVSACPAGPHETASCSGAGICGKSCDSGFADCTGAAGCESDLTAVSTCGTCNTNCNSNPANAAPICTAQGCGMVCNEGWGDLNGNAADGCEHNVSTDAENCGSVGNSCYGGSCTQGVCEFEGIEEIAFVGRVNGQAGGITGMNLDGNYLYLQHADGRILKVKKDGSEAPIEMTSGYHAPTLDSLKVEDGYVVWITDDIYGKAKGLYAMPINGSAGSEVKLSGSTITGFDIEGGRVYWNNGKTDSTQFCTTGCTTTFYSIALNGTGFKTEATLSAAYHGEFIIKDGWAHLIQYTYFSASNEFSFNVYKLSLSDWTTFVSLSGTVNGAALARGMADVTITANYLVLHGYEMADLNGSATRVIRRMPLTGSNPHLNNVDVLTNAPGISSDSQQQRISADGSYIYYAKSGALHRVGINGGTPTQLGAFSQRVNHISEDANYVYYSSTPTAENGDVTILRIVK